MYRTFTNNEIITDGRENKNLARLAIDIPSNEIRWLRKAVCPTLCIFCVKCVFGFPWDCRCGCDTFRDFVAEIGDLEILWQHCGPMCSSVVLCSCVAVWLCVAAPLSLVQLATLFGLLPWGLLLLLSAAPYFPAAAAAAAYVNVMSNHWFGSVAQCKCCQASL